MNGLPRAFAPYRAIVSRVAFLTAAFCTVCGAVAHAQSIDTMWTWDGDGNWTTAVCWDNGVPAGSDYNVFIDDNNVAYDVTVTLDTTATIGDLTIYGGDVLLIPNSRALVVDGDISNGGEVRLNATTASTDLRFENEATLSGGGEVALNGDNSHLRDVSGGGLGHLINADNTIHGRGSIGMDTIQISNQSSGVIDADINGTTLHLDPNASGFLNQGTLQASGGGALSLEDGVFSNVGGIIQALASSTVRLEDVGIAGGTVASSGTGVIETVTWARLQDLTIDGTVRVNNYDDLFLIGTIENLGTIEINATTASTDLRIESEIILTGGGEVALNGSFSRVRDESGGGLGHLINTDNTIYGRGSIGLDSIAITNQSGGTIDADVIGTTLHVDPNAGGFLNQGLLQASGGGVLSLEDGTFTNTGATIQALDASVIQLDDATIVGGTLSAGGSGYVETTTWALLQDLTIAGTLHVRNYDELFLEGTINNTGTIELNATTVSTDLRIESEVTLTGDGEVLLGGANARILDEAGDPLGHLINVDNTIHGQGRIGYNRARITNQSAGTIDADVIGTILHVDPNASGLLNQGLLQASGGGVLSLEDGTFTNDRRHHPGAGRLGHPARRRDDRRRHPRDQRFRVCRDREFRAAARHKPRRQGFRPQQPQPFHRGHDQQHGDDRSQCYDLLQRPGARRRSHPHRGR